jgi:tetratricopeptide (TPR) repeat protein
MEQADKSLAEFQQALAIDEKIYPADSPHVATDYVSLGVVLVELDRAKEALDYQEKAVAILEKSPADNESKMSTALLDLANTYRSLKRFPEAARTYERGIAFAVKTVGADGLEVADIRNNQALLRMFMHDLPGAREAWRQALAIREKKLGPDHPEVAKSIAPLAEEAFERGAFAESLPLITRAIAIMEKSAPKLELTFEMIDMRAKAHLALHHYADAVTDETRARDGFLEIKSVTEAAAARLTLANALWALKQRPAAIAEVTAGIGELEAQAKPDADTLKSLRDWRAAHRR